MFLTNITINQHFHKLSSGQIIKHAHPYDKGKESTPFQEHQHTSAELFLLEYLTSSPVCLMMFLLFLVPIFTLIERKTSLFSVTFISHLLSSLRNYRAPPATSYCL
jgi:hypothetical protein